MVTATHRSVRSHWSAVRIPISCHTVPRVFERWGRVKRRVSGGWRINLCNNVPTHRRDSFLWPGDDRSVSQRAITPKLSSLLSLSRSCLLPFNSRVVRKFSRSFVSAVFHPLYLLSCVHDWFHFGRLFVLVRTYFWGKCDDDTEVDDQWKEDAEVWEQRRRVQGNWGKWGLFGKWQMIKSYIFIVVSNEETFCSMERQAFI